MLSSFDFYWYLLCFQIRSIFVVLSDDAFRKILHQFDKKKDRKAIQVSTSNRTTDQPMPASGHESAASSSSEEEVIDPVPVVQPPKSTSSSKNRNPKRGASSALLGPNAKK